VQLLAKESHSDQHGKLEQETSEGGALKLAEVVSKSSLKGRVTLSERLVCALTLSSVKQRTMLAT